MSGGCRTSGGSGRSGHRWSSDFHKYRSVAVAPVVRGPEDPDGVPDDAASVEALGCLRRSYPDDPEGDPDDLAGSG